jgi:hypothetical protein
VLTGRTPEQVSVYLVSGSGAVAMLGSGKTETRRQDVAEAFKNPALTMSGFGIAANGLTVPPGLYDVQIGQTYNDRVLACRPNTQMKVNA